MSVRRHVDLKSFLKWAYNSNQMMDQTQTVFRGTLYEYIAQAALHKKFYRSGLQPLTSVAGAADRGIDLRGSWKGTNGDIEVAVQCKSSMTKVAPQIWRELAGVHMQINPPAIAVLVSPLTMTAKSLAAFTSIDVPYLHVRVRYIQPLFDMELNAPVCAIQMKDILGFTVNPAASTLLTAKGITLPGHTSRL